MAQRQRQAGEQPPAAGAGSTKGHAPDMPPLTNGLAAAHTGLICFFSAMAVGCLWLSSLRPAAGGELKWRRVRAAKRAGGALGPASSARAVGQRQSPSQTLCRKRNAAGRAHRPPPLGSLHQATLTLHAWARQRATGARRGATAQWAPAHAHLHTLQRRPEGRVVQRGWVPAGGNGGRGANDGAQSGRPGRATRFKGAPPA